jgi:hypothetical protein
MALFPLLDLGEQVNTCGGWVRPGLDRGDGSISGTTKIGAGAGVPAICRVFLRSSSAMLMGFRRTTSSGSYTFNGLTSGRYQLLVEDDTLDSWRPKVELVDVA